MEIAKSILIIHASDADQHHGNLVKILDTLKTEDRITEYLSLDSKAVKEDSFTNIGKEDMVMLLLTDGIVEDKVTIEQWLLDFKKGQSGSKVAEIIIDNVPYETDFYALPESLEPIRSSQDMDGVWKGIEETLKKLFPKPEVVPPTPPPPTPTPVPPKPIPKSTWKKFLPYIFGVLALLAIFFVLRGCFDKRDDVPPATPASSEIIAKASVVAPRSVQGNCPHKFNFTGTIKVDGPMTVKYTWVKSNGTSDPVRSITFNAAGEKQINTSWTLESSYSGYQQIKIVSPRELLSNKANFRLQCTPTLPPPVTALDVNFANTPANGFIGYNYYANKGIKRIFSNSNGGYCDSTFPLIRGTGNSKYLSMAEQGVPGNCNTVLLNFEFERPMKRVTIYFIGAVTDYKLEAFSASGSNIGVRSKEGALGSVRSVTYQSGSANIAKVRFGHQAATNKVTRIRASQ